MSRGQRVRAAIAWVGLGLIAGALVWAVVSIALYAGYEDPGVEENAIIAAMVSFMLGLLVLGFVARWRGDAVDPDPDLRGAGCVVPVLIIGAVAAALVVFAHPEHMEGLAGAAPVQVHVWLITLAVLLGVLLIAPLAARPSVEPLDRTFPAFVSGILAVVLAGGLVHTVLYPEVRHTTADDPGEAAPVPESVTRVGWEWQPEWEPVAGTKLRRINEGTHGPLMVLTDGVVALDGTDGSELWSFRRPYDSISGVTVDGERVIVTHEPADGRTSTRAEVLDAATGELVPGLEEIPHPSSDDLPGEHVARTVDQVFRADTGDEAEDDTLLSSVEAATGEESWSASVPAGGGRVCEGDLPYLRHGLLISTHVCEDEETFDGETVGRKEDPDVYTEVEHVVTATDPDTGEEVWERTWAGIDDDRPWNSVPAGPVSEGASPVLLVEPLGGRNGVILDTATGEDAITLPSDLAEEDVYFEGVFAVDSESATYLVDRGEGNVVFERVDPQGEVIESVGSGNYWYRRTPGDAVALDQMVLTSDPGGIDDLSHPLVHVREFGEATELGSDPSILLGGAEVTDPAVEFRTVPGAVLAEAGDENTVYGLVP